MAQSLYTASAGMKAQQNNIDTIANNMANLTTTAFKRSRINSTEAVYSELSDPSNETGAANLQLGHGVLVAGQSKSFELGIMETTGRNLDLAIKGEGFFAIQNRDNGIEYTRNGALSSRNIDGTNYLTTMSGDFVLDRNGQKIKCNFPIEQININADGDMTNSEDPNATVATIGIFAFSNPEGLEELGNLNYRPTQASGDAAEASFGATEIIQGSLEQSNVDMADEMTKLIQAQRAYAFLSRAITTADQMKSIENDIRR